MVERRTIATTCTRDCPNTCGLIATVEDGRLVRLTGNPDHPLTRGTACRKANTYVKRVYSPERIVHPMIRENGRWQRVSWDTALDLVAEKLKAVCRESGPEAILYYQGYGERTGLKLLNRYFFNLLGGVTTLRGSLCGGTGQASQNLDFGTRISHDPLDHYHSQALILWARNPVSTNISLVPIARDIKKRGGVVVTIDPVRTKSAALADRHISVQPGKDLYLALAAAKIILANGAEHTAFLNECCSGAEQFRELLAAKSLQHLCEQAGVAEKDADYLASTLVDHFPAAILLGWGMHRYQDAHLSIRAIDALAAVAGTIGRSGGGVSQGFEEYGPYDQQYWGDHLTPPRRTLLLPRIGEELLAADQPRIRLIFVTAANPLCMAPNSNKVAQAFRKAESVIYSGHFLDDTADAADVFFPATTFLEENDVMASYGHNYVGAVNQAIEPFGECRSDFQLFAGLAERFPFADRFCRSSEQWLEDICAPIKAHGCSLQD
ncbi:MAG: molybdopterin-dependent oxidoreductase, partial [Desulfofustis sp.]|nr:molybdopterin-dependent oxidoreductase [Desulfofustis sp.]